MKQRKFARNTYRVQATVAEEPERTRLYDKMVEMMPGLHFDDYRRKTTRKIPVIVLTPEVSVKSPGPTIQI